MSLLRDDRGKPDRRESSEVRSALASPELAALEAVAELNGQFGQNATRPSVPGFDAWAATRLGPSACFLR